MAYSYTDQRGNGVARSFNFGFVGEDKGYIRATDIQVFTSNDGLNYQATSGWSLSGTNQITFLTAPANGLYVRVRRVVDKAKPFSKFDRSVTLDMLSLNNSFIQMLEVVHELMDGFYDDTFFFKQNVSMGGHNLTNLAQATQAGQAVRYEEWKNHEDRLKAVENDLTGVSSRTVPYYYIATGGETRWDVQGRTFNSAILFINGVFQNQSLGAFSITNNGFNFAEPLRKGDEVYALIGSTPATGNMLDDQDIEVLQPYTGAVPRTQHQKNLENISALDFAKGDGVSDDTLAFSYLSGVPNISLGSSTYKVTSLNLTQPVIRSDNATIRLSGRLNNIQAPLISSALVGSLNIVGDAPLQVNVLSASLHLEGTFPVEYYANDTRLAKYQLVDIELSSPATTGSFLLVNANQAGLSGCFEVVDQPSTNVARVLMLAQGALDLSSFTGTASIITTVLQFSNVRMLDISSGVLSLSNLVLVGPCFPYAYGTRGNMYDPAGTKSGATGVVARGGGTVKATSVGVSGVSGTQVSGVDGGTVDFTSCHISCGGRNGIAASNGKATFGSGVSSQNLLDNIISQDVSFVFAVAAKSYHSGRHAGIASNGSSLNTTNGDFSFSGYLDPTNGCGLSAASSILSAINCKTNNNSDSGIKAIGNSYVRATGLTSTGNNKGISVDTNSHAIVTGNISGNTTDATATNSSKIEAIGVTLATTSPSANKVDGTGALVQTTSTIPNFSTSGGLEVGGGGLITKVVRGAVLAVDFPSIPAGSQQSVSVTVLGVKVGDNTVVLINRRGTSDRAGLMYEAVVSADNTVLITANNFSTTAIDPPSENFNLVVFHF